VADAHEATVERLESRITGLRNSLEEAEVEQEELDECERDKDAAELELSTNEGVLAVKQ
jgi:hypothetical protein